MEASCKGRRQGSITRLGRKPALGPKRWQPESEDSVQVGSAARQHKAGLIRELEVGCSLQVGVWLRQLWEPMLTVTLGGGAIIHIVPTRKLKDRDVKFLK